MNEANKFGEFSAPPGRSEFYVPYPTCQTEESSFSVPYPPRECARSTGEERILEAAKTMREALVEAWSIFDQLGSHQPDDKRLAIVRSGEFASAAFRVRTAMMKTAHLSELKQ